MSDMTEFRPKTGGESALCLSGGGIRSATFCLGALQALAKFGWLRQFNYLSTVSGGGYIGSWLSAWIRLEEIRADRDPELQRLSDCELHEHAVAEVEKALRKSVTQGRTEPEPLRRLRAYSNYLSPVAGVSGDLLTLISIFIRNLALNWMVLFPAFFAIVLLPITIGAVSDILTQLNSNSGPWYLCFAIALACAVIAIAYSYGDLPDKQFHQTKRSFYWWLWMLPMVLGCFVLSLPTMTWVLTPDASFVPNSWFSLGFYPQWTCAGAAVAHLLGNLVGVLLSGALAGLLMWCAAAVTHWVLHANGPSSHALANSSACRPLLYAFTVPALMIIFQIGATVFMALLADSADEGARQRHQKSLANLRLRSYIRERSRALHV